MTLASAWMTAQSFAGRAPLAAEHLAESEACCPHCRDRGHVVDRLVAGRWVTVRVGCEVCGHPGGEL